MKLEFSHYEIFDSLKKNGLIPKNFDLDEINITFYKEGDKRKKPVKTHELVTEMTEFTLWGYMSDPVDCDCGDC